MFRKVLAVICLLIAIAASTSFAKETELLSYKIDLQIIRSGYDGLSCWVHARTGAIPGAGEGGRPAVVMTMQKLRISGSDIYYDLTDMRTDDLGKIWSRPVRHATLARRKEPNNVEVIGHDYTPKYHTATGKLLLTGKTARYEKDDNGPAFGLGSQPAYSIYDVNAKTFTPWAGMKMPDAKKFISTGAGCTQRVDLADGTILLPIAFGGRGSPDKRLSVVAVARCSFDGEKLQYIEHGNEIRLKISRGLAEPSLTYYKGKYFLTIRNDKAGYITTSEDGLHFAEPIKWTFDDGSDLGNYNTQQHWVTHSDGLFLVYNRRGANNDHISRHRAPLFIAQVDPERLCVIRKTEKILVPERGARLGNFGVTDIDQNQTWVIVTEWMQTTLPDRCDNRVCEKYGSNNAIFAAKIMWDKPNRQAFKY